MNRILIRIYALIPLLIGLLFGVLALKALYQTFSVGFSISLEAYVVICGLACLVFFYPAVKLIVSCSSGAVRQVTQMNLVLLYAFLYDLCSTGFLKVHISGFAHYIAQNVIIVKVPEPTLFALMSLFVPFLFVMSIQEYLCKFLVKFVERAAVQSNK